MINFDRDRFDELTSEQKIQFVNDLVLKNVKLRPAEIEYLVPQNRDKYFHNRVRTSEWMDDYEFDCLSDQEKEIYIWNKRFLDRRELQRLTPELQKQYIDSTINSGVQLTPEEFENLENDDLRAYYAKERNKYSIDVSFNPRELSFLDEDEQIQYINTILRMGMAPNVVDIPTFKPKALRFYQTHKSINEVRRLVRSELRKILS